MFSWLKDEDGAAVQACRLTSNVQLQQANAFILKVFDRDVLLPYPTNKTMTSLKTFIKIIIASRISFLLYFVPDTVIYAVISSFEIHFLH